MNFYDFDAWKEARKLTRLVYKFTELFPSKENFGLTSQMRRASISVMANIAEGCPEYSSRFE
jgi:four helix bundle protein